MPRPELLETFPNPYPGRGYEIAMECPEFTSLCPLGGIETDAAELRQLEGGAPDFATMHITYVPGDVLLFGPEPTGLPDEVLDDPRITARVRLPMLPGRRSMNLANSASIAVYEAWRQNGFALPE